MNRILEPNEKLNENIDKIYLNKTKTAWIQILELPEELKEYGRNNFDNLMNLKPNNKCKIIMFGKELNVNRYQQCYLNTPTVSSIPIQKQS